ncbi:hypothetical protein Lal_00021313 [Lupinus albus]|nr:hypothetical protein Lal_00021313 [Lupinus albus]
MFIDTLHPPFYGMMLGCVSQEFRQLMTIGEKIETRLRSGKGLKDPTQHINRDYAADEMMEGTSRKRKRKSHYDAIPMSYSELLPQLVQRGLLTILPFKDVVPPYPNGFNLNVCCMYHGGTSGHPTNGCNQLRGIV